MENFTIPDSITHSNSLNFLEDDVKDWMSFHEKNKDFECKIVRDAPLDELSDNVINYLKNKKPSKLMIFSGTLMSEFFETGIGKEIDKLLNSGVLKDLLVLSGPEIEDEHENKFLKKLSEWHSKFKEKVNYYYLEERLNVHGFFSDTFSCYQDLHLEIHFYRYQYEYQNSKVYDNAMKFIAQPNMDKELINPFGCLLDATFYEEYDNRKCNE